MKEARKEALTDCFEANGDEMLLDIGVDVRRHGVDEGGPGR